MPFLAWCTVWPMTLICFISCFLYIYSPPPSQPQVPLCGPRHHQPLHFKLHNPRLAPEWLYLWMFLLIRIPESPLGSYSTRVPTRFKKRLYAIHSTLRQIFSTRMTIAFLRLRIHSPSMIRMEVCWPNHFYWCMCHILYLTRVFVFVQSYRRYLLLIYQRRLLCHIWWKCCRIGWYLWWIGKYKLWCMCDRASIIQSHSEAIAFADGKSKQRADWFAQWKRCSVHKFSNEPFAHVVATADAYPKSLELCTAAKYSIAYYLEYTNLQSNRLTNKFTWTAVYGFSDQRCGFFST